MLTLVQFGEGEFQNVEKTIVLTWKKLTEFVYTSLHCKK